MPGRKPRDDGPPAFLRAAVAYADLTQENLGKAMNVSASTINRWLTGPSKADYAPPEPEQLEQVAELTGVPLFFLQRGFVFEGRQPQEQLFDDRLAELDARVAQHDDFIGEVRRQLRESYGADPDISDAELAAQVLPRLAAAALAQHPEGERPRASAGVPDRSAVSGEGTDG